MTDTDTRPTLTSFEGLPVRQVGIEIPAASGGLRDAMKIDPQEFHQGDVVFVVLECPVAKVRFEPIDKGDPTGDQRRVHVFGVEGATIVEADLVSHHLKAQRERIILAKEADAGIQRLYDDTPDGIHDQPADLYDDEGNLIPQPPRVMGDELQAAHDEGGHAGGLVDDCPSCDAERDAAEAEAAPTPITKARSGKSAG